MATKKPKILKDIDEFVMGKLDKIGKDAEEIGSATRETQHKCKNCSGTMKELVPVIEMGELVLHECRDCHEREYI